MNVIRQKYVAQLYTTYTYHLILKGHMYSYTRIRLEFCLKTSQEWVFPIYWLVLTVQLYHLDSFLCRGVGSYFYPSATWRSWTKSYCVTPAGGTRWVKCMWCECMRMFPHLCFQRCDLPHRSWVTWISIHTFSRYLNGPRWDDVRNTGTEPRAVEWRIPVMRPHVQAWLSWSERGTVNP